MPPPPLRRRLPASPYPFLAANIVAANSQSLSVADNASLSMGAGVRMTVACWFYLNSLTALNEHLVTKSVNTVGTIEYRLFVNSTNHLAVQVSSGAASVNPFIVGTVTTGVWIFALAIYDGANVTISQNNANAVSAAFSADIQDSTNAFYLGTLANLTQYMDGRIDMAGVWKRALTSAEQTTLYNNGNGLAYRDLSGDLKTSLSGWWDLDGSGRDASGNGNHLTNNNNVTYVAGKR